MDEQEKPKNPKRGRLHSKDQTVALRRRVAALTGAGMGDRDVAHQVGVDRTMVGRIRREIIPKDEELVRIREEARAEVAPEAIRLVKKNLKTIDAALDGVEVVVGKNKDGTVQTKVLPPPLSHQASALRELAALSGLNRDEREHQGPGIGPRQIPMTPEAISALIEAVRKHQAEQLQPRDVTAQGERIE